MRTILLQVSTDYINIFQVASLALAPLSVKDMSVKAKSTIIMDK